MVAALAALLTMAVAGGFAGVTAKMLEAQRERNEKDLALREREEAYYPAQIMRAERAVEQGDLPRAERELDLCAVRLRAFEWNYLKRLCKPNRQVWLQNEGIFSKLAVSPDSQLVAASGPKDGTVYIFEPLTGRIRHKLFGHSELVSACAFSPDGARLVTAGHDKTVVIWDIAKGQKLHTVEEFAKSTLGVVAVAFLPGGSEFVTACERPVFTKGYPVHIEVWDARTGKQVRKSVIDNRIPGVAVGFSHDGKFTAIWRSLNDYTGHWPTDVRVLNSATVAPVCTLQGHGARVNAVAFGPDGGSFATASDDRTVCLWDAAGHKRHTFNFQGIVDTVAYSPDGRQVAAAGEDRVITTWDNQSGAEVRTFRGHNRRVLALGFCPDGRSLVSAGQDGGVSLWPLGAAGKGAIRQPWGVVTDLSVSPDGRRLATAHLGGPVRLIDLDTGAEIRQIDGPWLSVAFSPDGTRLVTAGTEGGRLWDVTSGQEILALSGLQSGVGFSPDGRLVAGIATDAKTVLILDAPTGEVRHRLTGPWDGRTASFAMSADGKRAAAAGANGKVVVWNIATGNAVQTLDAGQNVTVRSLAFHPNGRLLAGGCSDNDVHVWDLETGERQMKITGHSREVTAVAFSPDGRTLATGGRDRLVRLWTAVTGQSLLTLGGWEEETINALRFTPDGTRLIAGGGSISEQRTPAGDAPNPNRCEIVPWDARPVAP